MTQYGRYIAVTDGASVVGATVGTPLAEAVGASVGNAVGSCVGEPAHRDK
jgi:hypothetical protein